MDSTVDFSKESPKDYSRNSGNNCSSNSFKCSRKEEFLEIFLQKVLQNVLQKFIRQLCKDLQEYTMTSIRNFSKIFSKNCSRIFFKSSPIIVRGSSKDFSGCYSKYTPQEFSKIPPGVPLTMISPRIYPIMVNLGIPLSVIQNCFSGISP